ncbi:MAG: homoserine dehydrogenase [Thermoguttaceae bacterium]|nr:homoserine dehydrogenase [Thermoguttaceae bacterium]
MDSVKVGLLGFGTIGGGVAEILLGKSEQIARATGKKIELVKICDKDLTSDRGVSIPDGILTDNLAEIMDDPEISIVIELIGGIEPARSFVLRALESGKDVVTANKALLANCGPELFAKARELGRTIGFEASVCGGVPVLASIQTSLQANEIESIKAIVNGTCNFILSEMESKGSAYADVLKEAQRLGFAEANPTLDVDGSDSTQKLCILAQLAFGAVTDWKAISRVGVDVVDSIDVKFARELGRKIRLLAVAERSNEGLVLQVCPTLIPEDSALAKVTNAYNGIEIVGDFVGSVFYQGWGAGRRPTASAVCSDVIDSALGRTKITFDSLRLWSDQREGVPVMDSKKIRGRAYLRLGVEDKPGVMAKVAETLAKRDVSIESMLQPPKARPDDPIASLIILTHETSSEALDDAVAELNASSFIRGKTIRLAVRD